MFSILPQELVREIISFVPEYGFMVSKSLHVDLKYIQYSFYCDPHKFAVAMNIMKAKKYNVAAEMMIICYGMIVNDCVNLTDIKYDFETDVNYELEQKCVSGIDEFEPYIWSCNVLTSDHAELFYQTFYRKFPQNCYKHLPGAIRNVVLYSRSLVEYDTMSENEVRSIHGTIKKVMAYIFAHRYGLIETNAAKEKIATIMSQDDFPDLLNVIALVARNRFYDSFFELYHGHTTAIICRDIFRDLSSNRSRYYEMMIEKRIDLIIETFGCHLTDEKDVCQFPTAYKKYMTIRLLENIDSKNKDDIIRDALKLGAIILDKYDPIN